MAIIITTRCKILLFYYYIIDISQSLVAKSQTSAFLSWPKTHKIKKHQWESAGKPKLLGNCWAVDIFFYNNDNDNNEDSE